MEVLILDHHSGYLSWAEYLENRQRMANNIAGRASQSAGAVKQGAALLSGLLRCGRCGRKLQVGYSGTHGQVGRYLCSGRRDERGSGSCTSLGSLRLDAAVVQEVLTAISPAGLRRRSGDGGHRSGRSAAASGAGTGVGAGAL